MQQVSLFLDQKSSKDNVKTLIIKHFSQDCFLHSRLHKGSPAGFTGLILLGITVSCWCLIRGSFLTRWKGVDVEMTVMNYLYVLWPQMVRSHFHDLIFHLFKRISFLAGYSEGRWFQVTLINVESSLGELVLWHVLLFRSYKNEWKLSHSILGEKI